MTFADELYASATPFPIETHPFVTSVCNGTCSREDIKAFALRLASSTESFSRSLFAILGACTDLRVTRSLLTNVMEEEGVTSYTGADRVTFDPARRHAQMARKFAYATGGSEAEVDALGIEPPRWFRESLQRGNWIGPYAFVSVGTEAHIPPTFRMLIPAFREHYGFSDEELEFFIEHVTVDDRHALDGAKAIEMIATTDKARRQALQGARRGGVSWWLMLAKEIHAPRPALTTA